ncbi:MULTISPECIES: OsmC family protein [unclassified Undibacterium]|uniref:OsmC family protein n=1 Tax=unclassified Undibacterium TaxID=2630295 RepID=UPI002AC89FA5|nr:MULTISPECIES: OsmC family protein [unclassified Undibacterium]MEB0138138.1 OsmC family protein [Undibacterium sp. CCC2.1]MEB0171107.1 OsmC family protein [Undibacterium sp. CCC1.1]MEB0175152.1 OsmC family protein [Undibacterium sp. CCC3.4]MEB0214264.1 OsmC family protein [Undibacterium sp. 5I2]WPX41844.1 OsmC family protein [Undibacterium sp. CCC3.4]
MDNYQAQVIWQRQQQEFSDNKYSRAHEWKFDGGLSVPASSAPSSVPLPYSLAENVDPEEALIAALASCHMLFFLAFACKQGYIIDTYDDEAIGTMSKNERGRLYISAITLRPRVLFSGDKTATAEQINALHELAHEHCYIANSVRAEVTIMAR